VRRANTEGLRQTFADGVDAERISHFGERFAYYTKRVRTLSLNQDHPSSDFTRKGFDNPNHYVVHPAVLVAWGRHHYLFPLLRALSVCGELSLDLARDDQALGHFLRASSLTALKVFRAGKLCNLTPDSVDALLHACIGLESMEFRLLTDEEDSGQMDTELRPWPKLLHKMVTSAARLRVLDLWSESIQWETVVHLAAMPTMQLLTANGIFGVPANPSLHVAAPFPALESLDITEDTPHLRLSHSLLQTCIMPHLMSLKIWITDHGLWDGLEASVEELHSLLALVGQHCTSLEHLDLNVFSTRLADIDLCRALPSLPHVTVLCLLGTHSNTLDIEGVRRVLALCPRLEVWEPHSVTLRAPVSLSELLELIQPYPSNSVLPVFIASADLPSEETITQFGTHLLDWLEVKEGVDTAELRDVVSTVLPNAILRKY
jgi:hypothetical protein